MRFVECSGVMLASSLVNIDELCYCSDALPAVLTFYAGAYDHVPSQLPVDALGCRSAVRYLRGYPQLAVLNRHMMLAANPGAVGFRVSGL